jgi:glycosyltransferase involved in cell wall biosynthesis
VATVSVVIPVLNGGERLVETLSAVRRQEVDQEVELLVADSGSIDGSVDLARGYGATVLKVAAGRFSHGGTRNLLLERAEGSHVAFLTQDAVPAHDRWLGRLLEGFELADDVALVFGPYRPRPDASPMVRRELEQWFASLAPDGNPTVSRGVHAVPFFTDANGCVARWAWERVPFRDVPYAEDRLLARDMLSAGYAKTYHPAAAVVHSHDYPPLRLFRRSFDEWRGLREVLGIAAEANPRRLALAVQRNVRDDLRWLRDEGEAGVRLPRAAVRSLAHHTAREAGAALGSRADRLPATVRRACSLERRAGFEPLA